MARILVAEDARLVRVILCRSLLPHKTIETGDGEEALALIREHRPQIAILDWNMPGLTGLEVCKAVRADPDLFQIRLVILTARSDFNAEREAREAGVDQFVRKPIMPRQIMAVVERLLAEPARAAPPIEAPVGKAGVGRGSSPPAAGAPSADNGLSPEHAPPSEAAESAGRGSPAGGASSAIPSMFANDTAPADPSEPDDGGVPVTADAGRAGESA